MGFWAPGVASWLERGHGVPAFTQEAGGPASPALIAGSQEHMWGSAVHLSPQPRSHLHFLEGIISRPSRTRTGALPRVCGQHLPWICSPLTTQPPRTVRGRRPLPGCVAWDAWLTSLIHTCEQRAQPLLSSSMTKETIVPSLALVPWAGCDSAHT